MARGPETFDLDPEKPAATRGRITVVETPDAFEADDAGAEAEALAASDKGWSFWTKAFWSALLGFVGLALTSAAYNFIENLVQKSETLGLLALGLGLLLLVSLVVLVAKEFAALARLGSARRMRLAADAAHASGRTADARSFINKINAFYRKDATTARGREALDAHAGEIIDGPDLVLLAERELLREKDEKVRIVIAQAARRVAMVTTISPRAWVDIGFVLAQSVMLVSKVANIYCGRPGGLAIWQLSARVATHLAVTGGVAVAHDVVGQFLGAGLVARLSSKLGEGVLNGVLTARVGLSAIAVCRPMPFRAFSPPSLSDVAGSLLTTREEPAKTAG